MVESEGTSRTYCRRIAPLALMVVFGAAIVAATPMLVKADAPGRGRTAQFEINYLTSIIDHHFSALRLTELAVGTDTVREADISPDEGTSPSPDFPPSPAKATLEHIKSLARRANRVQREEILEAQRFLREWYSIDHNPSISSNNRVQIELLEQAQAGDDFNHLFLEVFSRHHYTALTSTLDCLVAVEGMAARLVVTRASRAPRTPRASLRRVVPTLECKRIGHGRTGAIDPQGAVA